MYQILLWKTSISRWQRALHSSLFRHKTQLVVLESSPVELKGQKQFFIISVYFYPRIGYALCPLTKLTSF